MGGLVYISNYLQVCFSELFLPNFLLKLPVPKYINLCYIRVRLCKYVHLYFGFYNLVLYI